MNPQIAEVLKKFPTLSVMYNVLSDKEKEKLSASLEEVFVKQNPTGTKIEEVKPQVQLIIYYPDNIYTNKVHLKMMGSFVGVYLLRDDIDFGRQVRNAALLRNIDITSFEYTENTQLRTTIDDKSPLDIKISEQHQSSNTEEVERSSDPTQLNVDNVQSGNNQENNSGTTGDLFNQ